MNKNLFIGVDLGGVNKKTTGICVLEEKDDILKPFKNHCLGCQVIFGKKIFGTIKDYLKDTDVIAIDGSLSFGPGKGKMRLYEKFLSTSVFRKEKVSPLPPILMPQIVEEGIALIDELSKSNLAKDIDVVETFPTIVLGFCGDLERLIKKVEKKLKIRIEVPECEVSHKKSAFICALIAFLHAKNLTSFIGYRDGMLILPHFDFWEKSWQNKFKQTWLKKDYLKYRHLKTDIFS